MRKTLCSTCVAVLLGIILLGAGCSFDEPMNPSWNVNLVIPLAEQRYSVYDLKDSSGGPDSGYGIGFQDEEDSLLYFFFYDTFDPTELGDSLFIPPQSDSVSTGLGCAYFDPGIDDSVGFSLGQIYPEIEPFNHQIVPVPPFGFGPHAHNLAPFPNLQFVRVDSGRFHYTITNNLPVPIDTIHFRFFSTNTPTNIVVDTTVTEQIPPNSTYHGFSDLHNRRIDQLLTLEFEGYSPGSSGTVYIETSDSVSMEARVSRLRAREATGFFPSQSISTDTFVVWESEHTIRSLGINRGQARVTGVNETQANAIVTLRLHNFTNHSGDTLTDVIEIPPESTVDHTLVLDGYTLIIPDPESHHLDVYSRADFDSTNQWIHFSSDEVVYADLNLDTTYLDFIDGIIDPITVDITPNEQEVGQIPEGWDQLTIAGATLRLRLNSDIVTTVTTNISLYAQRNGVIVDCVNIAETIIPNRDTVLVIEGLESLINARPDMIVIGGTAGIGGDLYLESSNYVGGELDVNVPLSFSLVPTMIRGRTETIADPIDEDINEATVTATVHNHLPMSGRILVLAANDTTILLNHPELADTLVEAVVPQPVIANGRVQEAVEEETLFKLTQAKIDLFRTAPTYIKLYFYLDGTGGDTLSVYGRDYLGVSAIGNFIYEIDTE